MSKSHEMFVNEGDILDLGMSNDSSLYMLNVGLTSQLFLSSRCPKSYSDYSKLLHEKMDLLTKLNFFFIP